MKIDPYWILVVCTCVVFMIGFMAGYTLARIEANKLFDLRDRVVQLTKSRDRWQDGFDDLSKINKDLHEEINRLKSKEDKK